LREQLVVQPRDGEDRPRIQLIIADIVLAGLRRDGDLPAEQNRLERTVKSLPAQ
jgi:hypothetical protein